MNLRKPALAPVRIVDDILQLSSRAGAFPLSALSVLAVALVGSPLASAADVTFDASSGNGTLEDGAGTWDIGTTNTWTTDGGVTNTTYADNDNVTFGGGASGTAGTVSLAENVAPRSIVFDPEFDGDYTIDLNGFDLSPSLDNFGYVTGNSGFAPVTITDTVGTGSFVVPGNSSSISLTGSPLTIDAKITGAGRLFILGGGSLTVTNPANDFTGIFYKQNGGNLTFSSIADSGVPSAAGAGSSVQVGFNGNLVYTGGAASTNRDLRFFGSANGTITHNGSGALVWTGAFVNDSTGASSTFTFNGNSSDDNEIQGVIGDGANPLNVNKNGGGKWIFSGANTYSGTTTVNTGTLQIGNGGTTGSLNPAGTIDNTGGATLVFDRSDTVSEGVDFGSISGNGNITQNGLGTLVMSYVTHGGSTTVNSGVMRFENDTDLGAVDSNSFFINNGSTLEFFSDDGGGANRTVTNNKTFTFDSNGGGTVDFQKGNHLLQGNGTTFQNFITTGGTTCVVKTSGGGFWNLQGTGKPSFTVADGPDDVDLQLAVVFGNGNQINKDGNGKLQAIVGIGVNSQVNINAGTLDMGGTAQFSGGNLSAAVNNDGILGFSTTADQEISGVVSGIGDIDKSGSGVLTLTGTNTYTGFTDVTGGTLLVNGDNSGATGAVTVSTGATLGGTGTIGGAISIDDGTLAPGASIGTLTADAAITDTGSGTLLIEVDGNNGDQLVVNDSIDVSNLDLSISEINPLVGTVIIVDGDASATVTGTFNSVPAGYNVIYGYDDGGDTNNIALESAASPFSTWASMTGATDDPNVNDDTDTLINLFEFAFGLNPLVNDANPLDPAGPTPGTPTTEVTFGPLDFDAQFVRRKDGSVNYVVEFSNDLSTWEATAETPTVVANIDADYEIVEVSYPIMLSNGKKARFFRLVVTLN
ncbi:hypothetical protein HAHE_35310 [Haloferula helveola]|uniref:Autotransporter-associated beta strand repeat-containing protein n=1 Tax=Haloferula helveola TaxID=490095 RepID=A0ABN6H812_9BACT|nr:hypothetical protein HAHE_35310 [Haloferula helveola]